MIDIEKTISLRGYDPLMLSYGSDMKVWAICNICGDGRWLNFQGYSDLCLKCSHKTPKYRKGRSESAIKQFSDPKAREALRLKAIEQWNQENREAARLKSLEQWGDPDFRKFMSDAAIERCSDPEWRKMMSKIRLNSESAKTSYGEMRGGLDLVNHHYIYDHANPEKYTMKVTRSKHTHIHWWMYKSEVEVPHLNVTEENKYIFKGRKSL